MLVPLSNAKRHDRVEAEYARRLSEEAASLSDSGVSCVAAGKAGSDEELRAPGGIWHTYTVESLRAQVNEDVAASGYDIAYDREL